MPAQPSILAPVPAIARFVEWRLVPGQDPAPALARLASAVDPSVVVGLGQPLIAALGAVIDGLEVHPVIAGPGVAVPSTPSALLTWIRGADRGVVLHMHRAIRAFLAPALVEERVTDAFMYADSRDLSGYIDGTENPTDDDAVDAALVADGPLAGSSFVAVQRWVHDLDAMDAMSQVQRDHTIGRHHADNEERDDAPETAHVKRTAQEDFEPEAFVVRRSMPWATPDAEGLVFVAFGRSFDAYKALLARMTGQEDGGVDHLFRFTRPVTGAFYWCPPRTDAGLILP